MRVLERLVEDERVNAALAWPIVVAIVVVTAAFAGSGSYVWAALAATAMVLALVPTVRRWDALAMLPWEVLALAAAPLWLALLWDVPIAGFLTVATIALLATVELDAYTPVEMTARFAAAFVVLATMAVAACWVIARWAADSAFGTTHLEGIVPVMWELVYATAFGGLAGVLFVVYFFRFETAGGPRRGRNQTVAGETDARSAGETDARSTADSG
ncbi:hypothetical protein ACFQGT_00760 [Natrialbaceae archaeon GCM10025810]|uniref:hypothetical protein n=1 Tax=Halovalidus salilacus TaxID=3075124 RepID=UPI00360BD146